MDFNNIGPEKIEQPQSDTDFQCDNNPFHNQKYYETTYMKSEGPHVNGKCRFKNCEAPSIVDGFCPFHYNIVCQHETRYLLQNIVWYMQDMHRVLRHFEERMLLSPSGRCNHQVENQDGENHE